MRATHVKAPTVIEGGIPCPRETFLDYLLCRLQRSPPTLHFRACSTRTRSYRRHPPYNFVFPLHYFVSADAGKIKSINRDTNVAAAKLAKLRNQKIRSDQIFVPAPLSYNLSIGNAKMLRRHQIATAFPLRLSNHL